MEMRAIYAEEMAKLMEADKHVCILDADLAKASGTRKLYEQFPNQMFDCGIAEQNMASVAAGLASYGFKPWIESFCDQIAISIAYAGMNVKIVGTDPGVSAQLNGGTHMSMEDIGVLRSIPTMVIFEPVDERQLRAALPVINDYDGPVYIRLFRKEMPAVFGEDYKFDLFKADTLREGTDLTVFVSGFLTPDVVAAADKLKAEGLSVEVVNVHTIKPIDRETVIASAHKPGKVLTIENHNVVGGLQAAVLETLANDPVPTFAMGVQDRFGEVGKLPYLREVMGLTEADIYSRMKELAQK